MKLLKKLLTGLICMVMCVSTFACAGGNADDAYFEGTLTSNYNAIEGLDKDYVYMWYPDGLDPQKAFINFQTERYGLKFNSATGKIDSLSPLNSDSNYFEEMDDESLTFLPDMYYGVETSRGKIKTNGVVEASTDTNKLYARAIESGRDMQRLDVISMKYQSMEGTLIANNFLGRLEIAANREYFSLNYGVCNRGTSLVSDATLSFTLDFGFGYSDITSIDARRVSVKDAKGAGFTFVVPSGASYTVSGTAVTFVKTGFTLNTTVDYPGFGVVVLPSTSKVDSDALLAVENFEVSAVQKQPVDGRQQDMVYDANRGIYVINTDNMMPRYEPFTPSQLDSYEKLNFTITNDSEKDIIVPIAFEKTAGSSFNAQGYVPMLRRTDGNQTGISVQISKNWHTYDNGDTAQYDTNHYKRYLEGKWSMCYATVEVPAGETLEYEYLVAYAKWGGVYSISHSQLSLIGYAADWIWDQSVLGSWGESVCYDPDRCLGRSLIDDMRPFGIAGKAGSYNQYHWTDNVGGADFLWYYSLDEYGVLNEGRIIDQKINYRTQGPNMSDVIYLGRTADGCMDTFLNIRMGRTDDVIRCYYTITYRVVKDLVFTDLALFKLGAQKYASTSYTKFAVGNADGIIRNEDFVGLADPTPTEVTGDSPWFMLYGGETVQTTGNKLITVREFSAKVNGKKYDSPSYKVTTTNMGKFQPSFELSVPAAAGNVIQAGSYFDMVVEMAILPNPNVDGSASYYGTADYLVATQNLFDTADSALQQAQGNNLTVSTSVGTLRGTYPIEIDTKDGSTLAQFTMKGGLGYTPAVFNKLTSSSGYKLQINKGGSWVDIVQSGTKGETNDYYQVRRLHDGTYQWVFNVKNSEGTVFGTTNEYRLIKQ